MEKSNDLGVSRHLVRRKKDYSHFSLKFVRKKWKAHSGEKLDLVELIGEVQL